MFLIDSVVGFKLWDSGWPRRVSISQLKEGVAQFKFTPIPFAFSDWLIMALIVGAQIVLFSWTVKAWHRYDRRGA